MCYERIMAIEVTYEEGYQQYRESMTPILQAFGGSFGFDFKVSKVLKYKSNKLINRVFTIDFPSKAVMDQFFADPEYLQVKDKYFNVSVKSVTTISMHAKRC